MNTDNHQHYMGLLHSFVEAPEDPEANFAMALHYHSIEQTASAVSFYLRTAERASDKLLVYECLVRAASCFHTQGCRSASVEGMLQHAVSIAPDRPEAYFQLSRLYEKKESWHLGYMMASIGMGVAQRSPSPLRTEVDYPGFWSLEFERAVCGWWCGLCEESRLRFERILYGEPLDLPHRLASITNLKKLEAWTEESELPTLLRSREEEVTQSVYELEIYMPKHRGRLRHKFPGHDSIKRGYSEAWQDILVLTVHAGMRGGTYLEIGSGYPIYASNTYLLEKEFDWRGVSLDNQQKFTQKHLLHRSHTALCADASTCDYDDLAARCSIPAALDYLSVDCGDPAVSMAALRRAVSSGMRFGVITFDHGAGTHPGSTAREDSRSLLRKAGYMLLVSNVCHDGLSGYEDWWVDAERFDKPILGALRADNDKPKNANEIFLS